MSPPWRRHLGHFRSVTARPGGVLFGHVFALRARPGGVAWAAFALLRPPLWREWAAFPFCLSAPAREAHLGSCFIPGPALEAPLGHCTRVGTPKEGKLSLMTLTSNVKRDSGSHCPGRGTPGPIPRDQRAARFKVSWTSVRGLNQQKKKRKSALQVGYA